MSDSSPPKTRAHDARTDSDPLDGPLVAQMRALRDAPAGAEVMARMRAGLDARLAEADASASVVPLASHRRWRAWVGPAAAALAAGLALFFFQPSPDTAPMGEPSPPLGADALADAAPTLETASDEELAIALEYELLSDYDVIAQLDLLELLDEIEAGTQRGGEGRI